MIEYSRQRAGETLQNILFSFQYNPSRAISSGYDTLTSLQTSDSHLSDRNSHLMLLANLGATPPVLYLFHICKEYHSHRLVANKTPSRFADANFVVLYFPYSYCSQLRDQLSQLMGDLDGP